MGGLPFDAVAAKRIVYVVDASGSMLLHLSTVLGELERSLRTLHPKQEFGIIFFQKDYAIAVPPRKSLVFANAKNISEECRQLYCPHGFTAHRYHVRGSR